MKSLQYQCPAMPYTSPQRRFLEALNRVFNGYAFLLRFPSSGTDIEHVRTALKAFLASDDFTCSITQADKDLGYDYFYDYPTPMHTSDLVNVDADIVLRPVAIPLTYLVGMLTIDSHVGQFWSPYHSQLDIATAKDIASKFLAACNDDIQNFFIVEPNFLWKAGENGRNGFFENFADTASVIVGRRMCFLLITNGSD